MKRSRKKGIVIALLMALSLCACGKEEKKTIKESRDHGTQNQVMDEQITQKSKEEAVNNNFESYTFITPSAEILETTMKNRGIQIYDTTILFSENPKVEDLLKIDGMELSGDYSPELITKPGYRQYDFECKDLELEISAENTSDGHLPLSECYVTGVMVSSRDKNAEKLPVFGIGGLQFGSTLTETEDFYKGVSVEESGDIVYSYFDADEVATYILHSRDTTLGCHYENCRKH